MVWVNLLIVALLILGEAFFAISEMALVSLRDGQIAHLKSRGRAGRRVARLTEDPNRFLSAVQIGVSVTALLSAAFGAVTLSDSLARQLISWSMAPTPAHIIAFLVVTLGITLVTIVVGELVPKRLALQRAESIALVVAPIIDVVATVSRPLIWLLSSATDLLVRVLGGDPDAGRSALTDEELRHLVSGHTGLTHEERELIDDVFDAGDRELSEVMVPRTEVDFLEASMPWSEAAALIGASTHSRFPVTGVDEDDVIGFVHVRDLLVGGGPASRPGRVRDLVRPVMRLPDSRSVLAALSDLRRAGQHIAVVVDEFGGTAGIVTLEDLIEEVVGDIRDEYDDGESVTIHDGDTVEVDGLLRLDELEEETGIDLPEGPYDTVAGFIMARLGRLPVVDDQVGGPTWQLDVVALDGRRVDRVRVTKIAPVAPVDGEVATPDLG